MGSAWGSWALYTDSPLRAFEDELGVQAPVGFWDPLGYTKDGDIDAFRRRREVELKHGRVCMFATLGYIVPEYFRWPGEISPKAGLFFTDIPNGLAAISKVPPYGWVQIFLFIGLVDFGFYRQDPERAPADYERPHERRRGSQAQAECRARQRSPRDGGDHGDDVPERHRGHDGPRDVGILTGLAR